MSSGHYIVQFDPVIFSVGPLSIRWYGLMYVISFIIGGWLLKKIAKEGFFRVAVEKIDSLITYLLIGLFLGARLAYVFIYNWDYYSEHMSELFSIWEGGLSFHGGVFGMAVAAWIFAQKNKVTYLQLLDSMTLAGSQGLFWGRLGNFINGELYGRTTTSVFGVIFPEAGNLPRHASQLYEGIFEGFILTAIIWLAKKSFKFHGIATSMFLCGYGIFRFGIEFFREPDPQLGLVALGLSMGQILCLVTFVIGLGVFFISKKYNIAIGSTKNS